ncbi:hypothetical protein J6590_104811 [Homalodisca vitripennis]|nr:hypothetical protein J6590_104811 [Homalodisca vitripennis]
MNESVMSNATNYESCKNRQGLKIMVLMHDSAMCSITGIGDESCEDRQGLNNIELMNDSAITSATVYESPEHRHGLNNIKLINDSAITVLLYRRALSTDTD